MGTQNIFQLKSTKQEREAKFGTGEHGNANLSTRKKNLEKARENAEREEEMKEHRHALREGPAGTCAQLWHLKCLGSLVSPTGTVLIYQETVPKAKHWILKSN